MNARSLGLLLALVGLVLVAHPLYLFPHHGETAYSIMHVESVDEGSPADAVAYDELPPVARDRFEQALSDNYSADIWTGEHAVAYEALRNHRYVEYRDDYYEYRLRGADRLSPGAPVRMILSTLAVIALVVGAFAAKTGRRRPLKPLRACWIPVGVFAALVATEYYDVTFGNAHAPQSFVYLPAMAGAFVALSVVGSAVRRRGSLRPLLPVAVLVVAGTGLTVATGRTSAVGAGLVAFTLVTAPWFALGYRLTAPPAAS